MVSWSAVMVAAAGLALVGCGSESRGSNDSVGIDTLPMDTGNGTTGTASSGDSGPVATGDGTSADTSAGDDVNDTIETKWDLPEIPDIANQGNACITDPMADEDGDGFTVADGDCNDCDANVNPGAIEVEITEPDMMGMVPEPADEDCDGLIDNVPQPCDAGLALNANDPYDAAAAIGLCKTSSGVGDYGIVNAQFMRANGAAANAPLQNGIMGNFGDNVFPLEGDNLLVLSSGRARTPGQASACNDYSCQQSGAGTAPAGFPQDVPLCPGLNSIYDDIALEVTLRAPTNATGYAFSFDFYTFEYPEWVCDFYNDQFIALVSPPPPGSINGNISFDAMTNPVSVNVAFFEVCAAPCALGTSELLGTGFDLWDTNNTWPPYVPIEDAGATSWLVTTAPVDPGAEVTIRFAIWDTGDQLWDSTALIDNFRWIADGGTVMVGTTPEG